MNSKEVIWYKKAQKANSLVARSTSIKETATRRQIIIAEETQLLALTFANNIISKIYEVASSNAIFSKRWILVKTDSPFQIATAVDNFDIVANDDIIDIPATYAPIYVQTKLFEKTVSILLKDFLEDEGFYSIGEESPRMHGYNLLSEKNSWYALELN